MLLTVHDGIVLLPQEDQEEEEEEEEEEEKKKKPPINQTKRTRIKEGRNDAGKKFVGESEDRQVKKEGVERSKMSRMSRTRLNRIHLLISLVGILLVQLVGVGTTSAVKVSRAGKDRPTDPNFHSTESSYPHPRKNKAVSVSVDFEPRGFNIQMEVKMPQEAEVGSSVELICDWHLLGGSSLYSVKWYKDDHEFFQYVPENDPRIQTFTQTGVNLDKRSYNEKSIKLRSLILASSGQYKCEVSTEAPSFSTIYQTGNLTVIALPERGPEITGLSSHYAVGENVTANCTAWPSVPKANLRWTINGEPVPKENTIEHPPLLPVNSMGTPNSVGLRLEAESRHFEGGDNLVRIKCVAEVGSRVYEAEKRVLMAYVNNQRLSAGDHRDNGADWPSAAAASPSMLLLLVIVHLLLAT